MPVSIQWLLLSLVLIGLTMKPVFLVLLVVSGIVVVATSVNRLWR